MSDIYGNAGGYAEYCEARGYPVEASPDDPINQALLIASTYIDGRYRSSFSGKKVGGRAQVREWPREGATDASGEVIPDDEIPIEVIQATYEAARRQIENPGSLTPDYVASERTQSEKVGDLAVTYASSGYMSAADVYPVIADIDMILAPLIGNGNVANNLFGEAVHI